MLNQRNIKLLDRIGWFVERPLIWLICGSYSLLFLTSGVVSNFVYSQKIEAINSFLVLKYDQLISLNIGTITTIAAVFVGIYVTVLSIFGSLKVNSFLAHLDKSDVSKLIHYILSALIASFLVIFYSLIMLAIPNPFVRSFMIFILLMYMLLTAFRFAMIISVIYAHDLNRIISNLEKEKQEIEEDKHTMHLLGKYLAEKELEDLRHRSSVTAAILEQKRKN